MYNTNQMVNELLEGKPVKAKEIRVYNLDMTRALCFEDEVNIILRRLKRAGLYNPGLLFSAFNGAEMDKILREGMYTQSTEPGTFFCNTEEGFKNPETTALVYLTEFEKRALAVYESSFTEPADSITLDHFKFKAATDPLDALVAIFKLHYPETKAW